MAELIGDYLGALANQSFVKMNGIGNEIVVVDLRVGGGAIEPEEARAAAAPQGVGMASRFSVLWTR